MVNGARVFEIFAEAAEYARRHARSSGSTVPITRSGDIWYVGDTNIDRAESHEYEYDPDDYMSDEQWIEELRCDYPNARRARDLVDWSNTGDDMDERNYELFFGGPDDD